MIKFILSIAVAQVLSSAASAATTAVCPGVQGVVSDAIFIADTNCVVVDSLASEINRMQKLFGGPAVTLVVGSLKDNASFDGGHLIQLPYQMTMYSNYGMSYQIPLAGLVSISAHEYGHAIFDERLKKEFATEFGPLFKKMEEISGMMEKDFRAKSVDQEQLANGMKELIDLPNYDMYARGFTPYAELYADLLTVYAENDKSAILNALYYNEMDDMSFAYSRSRDFGSDPNPQYDRYMMSDDHSMFEYVRSYIGKNLWPQNDEQKKIYAQKIGDAIIKVFKENVKNRQAMGGEELNQQLITELKKINQ
jgi:hypothetical protein